MISQIVKDKKAYNGVTKIEDESDIFLFKTVVSILDTQEKNKRNTTNLKLSGILQKKSLRNNLKTGISDYRQEKLLSNW